MDNDRIIKEIEEKQDDILSNLNSESIDVYSFLKDEYAKGDILNNLVFQFVFKSFYGMDRLPNSQKICFFELLAQKKTNLKHILSELYETTSKIHFSFATKLLHTIDNDKPIFDSLVSEVVNIKVKGPDRNAKIHSCIEIYNSLETLYVELKDNDKIRKVISKFRLKFKVDDEKMSDTKVLDFIMWSLGKLKGKIKIHI